MKKTKENSESEKAEYGGKLTTIAVPMKVKEELQQYGTKGESYSTIITRLLKSARERILRDVLMNDERCITI